MAFGWPYPSRACPAQFGQPEFASRDKGLGRAPVAAGIAPPLFREAALLTHWLQPFAAGKTAFLLKALHWFAGFQPFARERDLSLFEKADCQIADGLRGRKQQWILVV